MSVIDIHTHAFPDNIAPAAMEKLSAMGDWKPAGDGTIDGLLASMDQAGIDVSAVCAIATKPGQVKGIVKWQRKIFSDRITPFCSLHPKEKKPEKWIRRFADEGFPAIKLHPMYQDFIIDDEAMFGIYEAAAEHGLTVTFHCGRDIGFMGDHAADRASPRRVANVLDKFPGLRILCTHMGGWKMWQQVNQYLIGKDVYLETSFSLGYLPDEQLLDMIRSHSPDRICFGTDWPWRNQHEELKRWEQIGLDKSGEPGEKTLQKLKMNNAARLLLT
ncbi:MAG: amidohydrolase family protein [Phycisphaerae bacterium]|nr:amidohydrolase family protein [Phycisphaerae bacterium]